jgi:hypothetical protein
MPTTITVIDHEELFAQLAFSYITCSETISLEHEQHGACEERRDDPLHDALHDTMREISRTILLFVDRLDDIPAIRDYNLARAYS